VISLSRLRADGITAESDFVSLDDFPVAQQFKRALFLEHEDAIGAQREVALGKQ
jgi:hypothetical protein